MEILPSDYSFGMDKESFILKTLMDIFWALQAKKFKFTNVLVKVTISWNIS